MGILIDLYVQKSLLLLKSYELIWQEQVPSIKVNKVQFNNM
jgi:hypothetical protein